MGCSKPIFGAQLRKQSRRKAKKKGKKIVLSKGVTYSMTSSSSLSLSHRVSNFYVMGFFSLECSYRIGNGSFCFKLCSPLNVAF